MADRISPEHRSWNMSRIRGKDTGPELSLRSLLHRAGFRYRLHDTTLPGKPDLVLPRYRTVIFVHGCYWHRHSGCKYAATPRTRTDFWLAKFQGTVERDRRTAEALARAPLWSSFRHSPHQLTAGPAATTKPIARMLDRTARELDTE